MLRADRKNDHCEEHHADEEDHVGAMMHPCSGEFVRPQRFDAHQTDNHQLSKLQTAFGIRLKLLLIDPVAVGSSLLVNPGLDI